MIEKIKIGQNYTSEMTVTDSVTAKVMGSGDMVTKVDGK